VRILAVTQGTWGQRIINHLGKSAPSEWVIVTWRGPTGLPVVLDEPEALLPDALPKSDVLLVLTESAGMTDLTPDIAQLCGAQAVIVPVDRRVWAPPGLLRQVKQRLAAMGIDGVFPMPFCSLSPTKKQHPLIQAFAQRFGRPELTCEVQEGRVVACDIVRETPCGNTRYIVEHLIGTSVEESVERAGLLHHYYPCWGGMDVDPVLGEHSLLHIAATMAQKSVEKALKHEKLQMRSGQ
jgi:hypothetical protein